MSGGEYQFGPAVRATLAVIQAAGPAGISRQDLALARGITSRAIHDSTRPLLHYGAIVAEAIPGTRQLRYRATAFGEAPPAAPQAGYADNAGAVLTALLRMRQELDGLIAILQRSRE